MVHRDKAIKHFYPIPRLAGQQPRYLENQLRAFGERRRANRIMENVARVLSPATIASLASHFHALNPKPFGGGTRDPPEGKRIFQGGVPEANIVACAACHGPDAEGSGEILEP